MATRFFFLAPCHVLKRKELVKQFGTIEMKVFSDEQG